MSAWFLTCHLRRAVLGASELPGGRRRAPHPDSTSMFPPLYEKSIRATHGGGQYRRLRHRILLFPLIFVPPLFNSFSSENAAGYP